MVPLGQRQKHSKRNGCESIHCIVIYFVILICPSVEDKALNHPFYTKHFSRQDVAVEFGLGKVGWLCCLGTLLRHPVQILSPLLGVSDQIKVTNLEVCLSCQISTVGPYLILLSWSIQGINQDNLQH
jgi:hypothetical protein